MCLKEMYYFACGQEKFPSHVNANRQCRKISEIDENFKSMGFFNIYIYILYVFF